MLQKKLFLKLISLFLCFNSFLNFCSCLVIDDSSFTCNGVLCLFQKFGFQAGGTTSITLKTSKEKLVNFFICIESDALQFYRQYNSDCSYILNPVVNCTYTSAVKAKYFELKNYPIKKAGMYHFLISNCETESSLNVNTSYTLLNLNGENLSTSYIYLPQAYLTLFGVWSLLLLFWLINWIFNCQIHIRLHKLLGLFLVCKLGWITYCTYFWNYISVNGIIGEWSKPILYSILVIPQLLFFAILLLVSKGWCITRTYLSSSEKKAIFFTVIILVASQIFYRVLGGFYLFALFVMYLIAYKMAFSGFTHNISVLNHQIALLIHHLPNFVGSETPLNSKLNVFRRVRYALIFLIFIDVILLLFLVFLLSNEGRIEILTQEGAQLIVSFTILWSLRLKQLPSIRPFPNQNKQGRAEFPEDLLFFYHISPLITAKYQEVDEIIVISTPTIKDAYQFGSIDISNNL
eukprot:TRINITY_DN2880_c0_g1_i1.p1 TRINITY_DN2880_c0_g1~~TRINITY_DN2880_c0_g1_i1.p1  ORF type:complete len:461 (-),score=108.97 TRINITY_DN2880_c0_g1_i1:60-1442(-)